MAARHVRVSTERIEEIAFRTGGTISGQRRVELVDGDTVYHATYPPEARESEVVRSEREEARSLRESAYDDSRLIAGTRVPADEIPSRDDL